MTRKHYNALAADLAIDWRNMGETERDGFRRAVSTLMATLMADNPRFDRARFLAAIGID